MKAERLVALLFTLQRRRSATAAELADEPSVSERTACAARSAQDQGDFPSAWPWSWVR